MEINFSFLKNYKSKKTIIYIQPYLYEYRNNIFEQISKEIDTIGIFKKKVIKTKLKYLGANPENQFSYIIKTIYLILCRKNFNKLIIFAPPITKNLGIITSLIILKLFRYPLIIHGQGLYKKIKPNFKDWIIHYFWISLSNKYLLYSSKGKIGPFKLDSFNKKLFIINNRFENFIDYSIPKDQLKIFSNPTISKPLKILFIGRDRPESNINFLIENFLDISNKFFLELHLIGSLKKSFSDPNIIEYGPLFNKDITSIARNCSIGIYPGNAGLSVLHYMCLGLCPVLHSSYECHAGPEPNYINDKRNGRLFKKDSGLSLKKILILLYKNPKYLNTLRLNAHEDAKKIHNIDYSVELKNILLDL